MTSPIWFFYHLPKTGGQTIRDHLHAGLGSEGYLHLGKWDRDRPLGFDDVAAMSADQLAGLRAIGGHPLTVKFHSLFADRSKREIVVVREPAARIVSHYNFSNTMRERRSEPLLDFEEFLTSQTNRQTIALVHRFGLPRSRQLLDKVLYGLTRCAFVGRTDDLDQTLPLLFGAIGISSEVKGRSNVTGETINRYVELTPSLSARLQAENPLDVMLYSAVGRLQDASVSRLQDSKD
ncbi:MAG: hypothetical protein CL991_07160 [Euryarchaeota archaeon]|nr:hypothetical protein [Euryarchaeota archaeon]